MRKTEEKVNFILRDVHKSELSRISEMKDRYEEQLLPLELEAQILQDSLDLLSIQALTGLSLIHISEPTRPRLI